MVSGNATLATQNLGLVFMASNSVTTNKGQDLKLQNAKLYLSNLTGENPSESASINVNVTLDAGASIQLDDNQWQMKNLTLSGSGAQFIIDNDYTLENYKTGANIGTLTVNNASAAVSLSQNSFITAKSILVENGSFTANSGASVSVTGDGSGDSVDFKGGKNISINNSSLNLNDVADTVGMTFTSGSGFATNKGFIDCSSA